MLTPEYKPFLQTVKDLWGKFFNKKEQQKAKAHTTAPPRSQKWLQEIWGGLSLKLLPAPIPPRPKDRSSRYGQIQRRQKMRRRLRNGPKYRRRKD